MPAPKAILRDINDHNLDPRVAYGRIARGGRLSGVAGLDEHLRHANVEPRPALVTLPVPKIDVSLETSQDGTLEEKISIEVGSLKMEVEVPIDSIETKTDDVDADVELPTVTTESDDLVVVASSKKLRAKKV